VDGSNLTLLYEITGFIRNIKWSPQGDRLLFVRDTVDPQVTELWVVNTDGTNATLLQTSPFSGQGFNAAAWAPSGTKIAFDVPPSPDKAGDVFAINPDGSGLANLSQDPAYALTPTWSPDGSRIGFLSGRAIPSSGIFVMDADGLNQAGLQVMGGNPQWSPASGSPPDTSITDSPLNPSNSSSASFAFTSTAAGSTFECQVDDSGFAACASPRRYTGLADGGHTFQARATDAFGRTDSEPASFGWTIDTVAPDTIIDSGPPATTIDTSATFTFHSTEAGSTFQCQRDGGSVTGCSSPVTYTGLGAGSHTLRVAATGAAGNTDPTPASYAWAIASCPSSATSMITSSFNSTAISAGTTIWFTSVISVKGLGTSPVILHFDLSTITFTAQGTAYTVTVPKAEITFSATATEATTVFDTATNTWKTTVPSGGVAGNVLLSGIGFSVPVNLPGGIKPVTWKGRFSSSTPGLSANWKWGAAVYKSFSPDNNALGVKPVDDKKASSFKNPDPAGTPESFKQFVIAGARGGGGSNFVGTYSGTGSATPCSY